MTTLSLPDINQQVGKAFAKERFGNVSNVLLEEVKSRKVVLRHFNREDRFTISIEEFKKYYKRTNAVEETENA